MAKIPEGKDNELVEEYEKQIRQAKQTKQLLQGRLEHIQPISATEKFRTALNKGIRFFQNPAFLWKNGNLTQKKRLVKIIFGQRPVFSPENGFRTARVPWIFKKNTAQMDGKSYLAAPTGFEPVFSP